MTRRPRPARRGMTLVETALVISVCLLFLFGIFEYARYIMTRELVENAAREGARFAVVHTYDMATTDVQNQVKSRLAGLDQSLGNFSIQVYASDGSGTNVGAWTDAGFDQYIAVQIDGDYKPVLPTFLFMPSVLHVQTKALMYSEAN
jgi:Flp pilus assembly protein TadG